MPRICYFYGIAIYMYHRDHAPPHFHAIYGSNEAEIEIATGRVLKGKLPKRALALVREWATAHQNELSETWQAARAQLPLNRIDPLR